MASTTTTTHTYPVAEPVVEQHEIKDPEETFPGEACNCYTYVRNRVPALPRMAALNPNVEPHVGAVALEQFGKIPHVSLVTAVTEEGVWVSESNFVHCTIGTRFIPYDKYSLRGFWADV